MNSLIRCWVSGRVPLHEPFPTSVVEHIFLPFVFGDPVFLNLRQFTRLFRLFLRGQVTRRRFTLIGAPRRICFCFKFLLLLQCFSNPRFLPFLSDRTPVPLHLNQQMECVFRYCVSRSSPARWFHVSFSARAVEHVFLPFVFGDPVFLQALDGTIGDHV